MSFFEWLKKLFRRRKPEVVSWTKPYATDLTTESRVNAYPVKPSLTKRKSSYVRVKPPPITSPSRYRKFFKKRQPTTARKLWKPKAKIEEDEEDFNVIFQEDD